MENAMQPPGIAGALVAPERDALDLEALLGDDDAQLVYEGLYRLREIKVEALDIVLAEGVSPHGRSFEPWDFGIPQIDRLLRRFGAEPVEAPPDPTGELTWDRPRISTSPCGPGSRSNGSTPARNCAQKPCSTNC